jgi:hypothetical protein
MPSFGLGGFVTGVSVDIGIEWMSGNDGSDSIGGRWEERELFPALTRRHQSRKRSRRLRDLPLFMDWRLRGGPE